MLLLSLALSHLFSDLGFLFQGEGHQFVSDAVLLVVVSGRRLTEEQKETGVRDAPAGSSHEAREGFLQFMREVFAICFVVFRQNS